MSAAVIEALAEAAARGVEVTIVTNADREPPALTLRWAFWNTNDSGWGRFEGAGYLAKVRDCDGDFSTWYVLRHETEVARGETHGFEPYHFDAALLAAEAALRADVQRRIAELRGQP